MGSRYINKTNLVVAQEKGGPRHSQFFSMHLPTCWLFLTLKYGKCRSIYHTWMLWVRICIQHVFKGHKHFWTAAKKNVKKAWFGCVRRSILADPTQKVGL